MIRDAEFDFVEHRDYNFNMIRSQASNVCHSLSDKESVLLKLEMKLHTEVFLYSSLWNLSEFNENRLINF